MKVFSIPSSLDAVLFDIDNTLYFNDRYYQLQIELLVRSFAQQKGIELGSARKMIEDEKKRYSAAYNGKKTSTGNIMQSLGISLEENARWRDELFKPEEYLEMDRETVDAITSLSSSYKLAAVTNNTVEIGRRTLAVLGLEGLISPVIGLDTCFASKPAVEPFKRALELLAVLPQNTVSIGDRYDVDLEIPLSMGMGGVLVEKLSDLYELPKVLSMNQK